MFEVISGREYPAKVIPLIEKAVSSIDIVVFDWRWYPQDPGAVCQLFNQSIIRAARRKVKIRVIANNDQIVEVLRREGCEAKRLKTTKLVHCKLMVIDNQIIITGSHNYTQSAFQMNLELSVVASDCFPVDRFLAFFNNLWCLG
jgi:phosphatidylserine/phosphatidylglycerophosphate/cardiolipin synthase-like enzyme